MKRIQLLAVLILFAFGATAQDNPAGEWRTLFGEKVFVESGSPLLNMEPGIPNPNPARDGGPSDGIVFINFDDQPAPCVFVETVPISDEYTALGVTFSGTGFSVLDQCGSFGVFGYSAPKFLAWNTAVTNDTETMSFTPVAKNVSFLAGSSTGNMLSAEAFDGDGQSLGIVSISLTSTLQPLSLPYMGIKEVQITAYGSQGVIDNLEFETYEQAEIPVSNWAVLIGILLIAGLVAVRFARR